MTQPIEPVRGSDPVARTLAPAIRALVQEALLLPLEAAAPPRVAVGDAPSLRQFPLALPDVAALRPQVPGDIAPDLVPLDLVRGRLAPDDVRDVAQDALRDSADAQDISPARLASRAAVTEPERLPSRNEADAQSIVRKAVLARDETGDLVTLDLHLSRASESRWEAAVYDRAAAARAGGFPYADPAVGVASLQFDPNAGCFTLVNTGRMLQVIPAAAPEPNLDMRFLRPTFALLALGATAIGVLIVARLLA